RVSLEEEHQNKMRQINMSALNIANVDKATGVYKQFFDYVGLSDGLNLAHHQHIENMKKKIKELKEFQVSAWNNEPKILSKNMTKIKAANQDYIHYRTQVLPVVQKVYVEKWEEIEKSTEGGSPIATNVMSPVAMSPARSSIDEQPKNMSMDEDRSKVKTDGVLATSPSHQSRIERFMKKQFSHAKGQEDINKQNIRIAKLKKSQLILDVLQFTLSAEIDQLQQSEKPMNDLLNSVNTTEIPEPDFKRILDKFKCPSPVLYHNRKVGVCKDLIFGTSLMEYAQQRNRTVPLLITKCIGAIERLNGLEREGIYRVSGKKSNIEKIKCAFERDEAAVEIGQDDVPEDVFSLASTIKIFFRELQTPLFPFKLTDRLVYSLALFYSSIVLIFYNRLEKNSEKNKMTAGNITLIFTPAIFHDLNHAETSPGEWREDCVLKDLILNSDTVFADKDLHNNSAITGDIQYGFDEITTSHSDMMYGMPYEDSVCESEDSNSSLMHKYDDTEEEGRADEEERSIHSIESQTHYGQDSLTIQQLPHRGSSRPSSPIPETIHNESHADIPPVPAHEEVVSERHTEKKKYQERFQVKGLKLNTGPTSNADRPNGQNIYPSVKSATIPSYSWLNYDPEGNHPPMPVPRLNRSCTTGRKQPTQRRHNNNKPDEFYFPSEDSKYTPKYSMI
ncbi:hypothetical protein BDB01DRAFT_725565, partial [Pilobolus umbonatus]